MEKNKIIEGNKLIAEFMGKIPADYLPMYFHSSWDWLMPVVEKIEKKMNMWFRIERDYVFICRFSDYSGVIIKTNTFVHNKGKIHGVWLAVTEFIKWYNENKK